MAWKGQSDNNIWFCQYGKNGWGKTSQLPNFQTSTGPALGVGDTGYLHMAWKGAGDTDIRTAHLTAGTAWSPQAPGKGWSSQTQIPVIATSMSPALASQFSASTDILLAWAGAVAEISHHVYVGPLDTLESKQSQTYVFSIGRVNVVTQRSPDLGESDTDFLTLCVAVGSRPVVASTVSLGDHTYGDVFDANLSVTAEVADGDRVIMCYVMNNQGFTEPDLASTDLQFATVTVTRAAIAAFAAGGAEVSTLNLFLESENILVPTSGSALTAALGDWLFGAIGDGSGVPDTCDGPVAAGVHAFTGARLRKGQSATDNCPGIDLPGGCGSNSLYQVAWAISGQG